MKWRMNENSLFASRAALVVADQFRHCQGVERRCDRAAARGVPDLRHGYRRSVSHDRRCRRLGAVPGAVNVPRGAIEFRFWKLVGFPDNTRMNTKMTLYCATGGRCALAAKSLQDLGFTNATSVDMLFNDWVKAGYPAAKPK